MTPVEHAPVTTSSVPTAEKKAPWKDLMSKVFKGAAVAAVTIALLFGNVHPAEAARSAGRVGGFAGSSSSAPSRSYGGGGGGYRGGGYSSPAPSVYYGGSSYYGGSTLLAPRIIAPSPVVVSPYAVSPVVTVTSPGTSAALDGILLMALAFVAFSSISSVLGPSRSGGLLSSDADGAAGGLVLHKVQVGLLAVARELKADLDEIAEEADTSSSEGLKELVQEVTLALLRNPQYAAYASSSKKTVDSGEELERVFNRASLAERSKFSVETLVNVKGGGGVRHGRMRAQDRTGHPDELIVVTLLVATRGGVSGLPSKVNSADSLKAALRALGALRREQVLGAEVLWTPQAAGDSFSRDELARDYPDMHLL